MYLHIIFVFVFIFFNCNGKPELPPSIIRCTPTSSGCFKRQLQTIFNVLQTDPTSLKVNDIQPIKIKSWSVNLGPKHIGHNQIYTNLKLYNHAFNEVESVRNNIIGGNLMTFNVSVTNPEVIFVANFEFKNATFFQVSSKGQVTYVHKGFKADFNMTGEIEKRKNDRYIKLVDLNLQLSSSRIAYQFKTKDPKHDRVKDNVFNYNWKLALRDLKTGYEQIYAHAYRTTMERILAAFPYDSIFID